MAVSSGWTLLAPLFEAFEGATRTYVTDISTRMIATVIPVVSAGLTVGFLVYALAVIRGTVQTPVSDLLWRCFRIGVIVSIASAGGLYQSTLADVIISTPDALAQSLIGTESGATSAGQILDDSINSAVVVTAKQWEKASVFSKQGIMYVVYSALIMVSAAIMVGIGGAFLIMAKVALSLLVAMGPLFILMLLWEPTKKFFEAWAGQIVTYGLTIVLYSITFTFLIGLYGTYMGNYQPGSNTINAIFALMGALIISVVSIVILLQLPSIAGALSAGGMALSYMREGRATQRILSKAMSGAKTGAKAAGRTAMAGGRVAMAGAGATVRTIAAFARGSMK